MEKFKEFIGVASALVFYGLIIGGLIWLSSSSGQSDSSQADTPPASASTVSEDPSPPDNTYDYPDDSNTDNCSPDYDPCVPDVSYDLDCSDVGEQVTVVGNDPYGLDGDGDGIGCESY